MAATAAQVARLRRMVAEPSTATYSDAALTDVIERYPVADAFAQEPRVTDYATYPPALIENELWASTYDLHAAAADIWSEKAAGYADEFDVQFGSKRFARNQQYANALQQARYHTARRVLRYAEVIPSRRVLNPPVANYPEAFYEDL